MGAKHSSPSRVSPALRLQTSRGSYSCRLGASAWWSAGMRSSCHLACFSGILLSGSPLSYLFLRSRWLKGRHPMSAPPSQRRPPPTMVSPHGCVSGIPRKSHQRLLNICNGKRSFRSVDELCRAGAEAGNKQCPWAVTKWKLPRWPHP